MLEILIELGLSEELAEKVIEAFEKYAKENAANEQEKEIDEDTQEEKETEKKENPEIPPMGKAEDDIPSKEEFEKMGYLARVELAKANPEVYKRLKNRR